MMAHAMFIESKLTARLSQADHSNECQEWHFSENP